jgi:HEAT repeat protein
MDFNRYVADLEDQNEHVRAAAADRLALLGDPGALEPLIASLFRCTSDCDCGLWAAQRAIATFGAIGLERVMYHSYDDDGFNRALFVQALGYFDDACARDRLLAVLNDPYPFVRIRAAEALGQSRHQVVWPTLYDLACDQHQPTQTRVTVMSTFYHTSDPAARAVLRMLLTDPDATIRAAAKHAYGER